jgi:hypothetical protein
MSNKKLRKMGKKLLVGASSSIVAGLLIAGTATNVFADTTDYAPQATAYEQSTGQTGMHMMHRWNSGTKAAGLAVQLGLDKQKIKQEIKSGKSMKQILQEHGIVPGQLQKAFDSSNKPQWKKGKKI